MRFLLSLLLLTAAFPVFAQNDASRTGAIERLQRAGAVWRTGAGPYTAVDLGNGLSFGVGDAEAAARTFLTEYGPAFGMNDGAEVALLGLSKTSTRGLLFARGGVGTTLGEVGNKRDPAICCFCAQPYNLPFVSS